MSKSAVALLLALVVGFALLWSYAVGTLILQLEVSAMDTMERYCGPETAKRFKEMR